MDWKEFLRPTIGKIIIFLILMGGLNYLVISTTYVAQQNKYLSSDEPCFGYAMNGFRNRFGLSINLEDITEFHCASGTPYIQYEIRGTDIQGRSFYAHHLGAGMAASGADQLDDSCLIINGNIIISEKFEGQQRNQYEGTCNFNSTGFPPPTSEYVFP